MIVRCGVPKEIYYSEGVGSKHSIKILSFCRFNLNVINYKGQMVFGRGAGGWLFCWERLGCCWGLRLRRGVSLCRALGQCHADWGARQGSKPTLSEVDTDVQQWEPLDPDEHQRQGWGLGFSHSTLSRPVQQARLLAGSLKVPRLVLWHWASPPNWTTIFPV